MQKILSFLTTHRAAEAKENYDFLYKAQVMIVIWTVMSVVSLIFLVTRSNINPYYMISLSLIFVWGLTGLGLLKFSRIKLNWLSLSTVIFLNLVIFNLLFNSKVYFGSAPYWLPVLFLLTVFMFGVDKSFFFVLIYAAFIIFNNLAKKKYGLSLPEGMVFEKWSVNFLIDQVASIVCLYPILYFLLKSRDKAFTDRLRFKQDIEANTKLVEMGRMAGGVAHEINNPLSVISGLSRVVAKQLNKENPDLDLVKNDFSKIQKSCERITDIISNMKKLAREGSSDALSKVKLNDLLEEVEDIYAERMRFLGIEFQVPHLENDIYIMAKGSQIYQIIVNLVNNSIDAIEELDQKLVKIEIQETENIEIMVVDSGEGIPEQIEKEVFQPFFTTKDVGKGTGLGLSIVKTMVESHGAELVVDRRFNDSRITLKYKKIN